MLEEGMRSVQEALLARACQRPPASPETITPGVFAGQSKRNKKLDSCVHHLKRLTHQAELTRSKAQEFPEFEVNVSILSGANCRCRVSGCSSDVDVKRFALEQMYSGERFFPHDWKLVQGFTVVNKTGSSRWKMYENAGKFYEEAFEFTLVRDAKCRRAAAFAGP